MKDSKLYACLVVYALTWVGIYLFVAHERTQIRMPDGIYVQTGFMKFEHDGKDLMVPFYLKKE